MSVYDWAKIEDLMGQTISTILQQKDELRFMLSDGRELVMSHRQDCCETVTIDDICGDLADLTGSPILMAEEVTSNDDPDGVEIKDGWRESFTWTFYKIATVNGYVTIRWYGTSNGYYSERVDLWWGDSK